MAAGPEADAVEAARAAFASGRTRPLSWRRDQLRALEAFVGGEEAALRAALRADLGRAGAESFLAELHGVRAEARLLRRHLRRWTRVRRGHVPLVLRPAHARLWREPLGVVLIIGPWNYPVNLVLVPLAAALAAGNAAVVKPSELAPTTAALLAERLPRYLDTEAIRVVTGGAATAEALIDADVDHVFFTGGTAVGRLVMARAARHLTPVTLELGGKSPVLVDAEVDLAVAARRIAWGKFMNAGQSCVAPDYVLVDERGEDALLEALARATRELFGADPRTSPDFARIVNEAHLERVSGLLANHGGRVIVGGEIDAPARYVAPTIVARPAADSDLMHEEIFAPVLPVVPVADLEESARTLGALATPLALYVFSANRARARRLVAATRSGAVAVNTTMLHFAAHDLPFGGRGASGFGQYHGRAGLERLSQLRPVLIKAAHPDFSLAYPPYGRRRARLARRVLGERGRTPESS